MAEGIFDMHEAALCEICMRVTWAAEDRSIFQHWLEVTRLANHAAFVAEILMEMLTPTGSWVAVSFAATESI